MILTLGEQVQDLIEYSKNPSQRIRTGFSRIDELCGGPAAGEVFMILGRSYTGKSLVAQNIINYNHNLPSIFFSLEMPYIQALQRLYSIWSGTPQDDVQDMTQSGSLPEHVRTLPTHFPNHVIVDKPALGLDDMANYIKMYDETFGQRPAFVIIDYLELIGGAKRTGEGWLATESVAASLKDFAKGEDIPVFVVHQTNMQEPPWKPPTPNSARGAGFTEADFVVGLWNPSIDPGLGYYERLELAGQRWFNILKNRAYGRNAGGKPIHYELKNDLTFHQLGST